MNIAFNNENRTYCIIHRFDMLKLKILVTILVSNCGVIVSNCGVGYEIWGERINPGDKKSVSERRTYRTL